MLLGLLFVGFFIALALYRSLETTLDTQATQPSAITLSINAPFSQSTITITPKDLQLKYYLKLRGKEDQSYQQLISENEIAEMQSKIDESKFSQLNNKSRKDNDPTDGSTYAISIDNSTISCYEFNCEPNFLLLKDYIISLMDIELVEIGI